MYGTATDLESPDVSLETMWALAGELQERAARSHPIAIWFIDRDLAHAEFRAVVNSQGDVGDLSVFSHVPIRKWDSRELGRHIVDLCLQDKTLLHQISIRKEFPFRRPGIFIEMSDGKHYLVNEF